MIVEQILQEKNRVRHYSDLNVCIKQVETGKLYEDAVDVIPCPYTYEETDELIEDTDATEEDYKEELERLGVNLNEA